MTARNAEQLVESAHEWEAKDWWRLELALFRDEPRVKSQLDILAPRDVWSESPGHATGRGCLQALSYVYALAASVVCVLAIVAWFVNGRIDELPVRLIGILTLISLVCVTLLDAIRGRHVRRYVGWRAVLTTTLFRIVPDALMLLVAWRTEPELHPSDSGFWLIVVAVDLVIQVVLLARGPSRPDGPQSYLENVLQAVIEMDASARDSVFDERQRAIARLGERGLIDDGARHAAAATRLGLMAATMAPGADEEQYRVTRPDFGRY